MKRYFIFLLCLLFIPVLTGCGSQSPIGEIDTRIEEVQETADQEYDQSGNVDPDAVDVDLTVLSSTMVYSEVYNMMSEPSSYIGKTVKMAGPFACFHDDATDKYYFACIIRDATACCAQGLEFVLKDERSYPDEYPELNEEICVVGVFDTYKEGEYLYCTLRNAELL